MMWQKAWRLCAHVPPLELAQRPPLKKTTRRAIMPLRAVGEKQNIAKFRAVSFVSAFNA